MERPRSRLAGRRLGFKVATALLVLVVLEAGAFLLLSLFGSSVAATEPREESSEGGVTENAASRLNKGPSFHGTEALHPYLGYATDPSRWPGADPESELSRYGFPFNVEKQLFYEPSEDRLLVAVVGGSVASLAAMGTYSLERELAKVERFAGRDIKVLSLAIGGYKQPQQLLALTYLLSLGAHFDLVINVDGFNELALSSREPEDVPAFPFFPRDWHLRTAELDSRQTQIVAELGWHRERRRRWRERLGRGPLGWSQLVRAVGLGIDRRLDGRIVDLQVQLEEAKVASQDSHLGPRRSYQDQAAMVEDLAAVWMESSLQLARLCESQGIEYRHYLQPNQYVLDSKPVGAERRAGTWRADYRYRPIIEAGYPRLRARGEDLVKSGVGFEDLSRLFAGRSELLYSDECCHLNLLGNSLLKRALAESLGAGAFGVENVGDGRLALEGFDPVAYFDGSATRGLEEFEIEVDSLRYRFVDQTHRDRFLDDPKRYSPQYGGWCALGMGSDGLGAAVPAGRYPADPKSFAVVEDRLYLFFRSPQFDARSWWLEESSKYRRLADQQWTKWTESER